MMNIVDAYLRMIEYFFLLVGRLIVCNKVHKRKKQAQVGAEFMPLDGSFKRDAQERQQEGALGCWQQREPKVQDCCLAKRIGHSIPREREGISGKHKGVEKEEEDDH